MEDINARVLLEGYGIRLAYAGRGRGSFVCKTDRGMKELRKYHGEERALLFENAVREYLIKNGFRQTAPWIKTVKGDCYYVCDGAPYVLEEYFEGDAADLQDSVQLLEAAETLANLHRASVGMKNTQKSVGAGRLPEIYNRRYAELCRIKKRIGAQGNWSAIDMLVWKNVPDCLRKIKQASALLEEADYHQECLKNSVICHNMYKGDNIRKKNAGGLYITGFLRCGQDIAVADVSDFIRRYVKKADADRETVEKILETYGSVREITKTDKKLLLAMLTYPYKFVKLCNEYYNKRRVYVSDAMLQKMERCILQQERMAALLEQLHW